MDRSSFKWVLIEFPSCFFDHWEMCPFVLAFFKIKVGAYWWTALERLWPCSLVRNRRVRFRFFARGSRSFITVRSRTDEPHSTELNRIFVLYFLFLFLFFCLLTSFKSHPSDFDRSLYLPPFFLRLASGCWWFSLKKKVVHWRFSFVLFFLVVVVVVFLFCGRGHSSDVILVGSGADFRGCPDWLRTRLRIRCGFGADSVRIRCGLQTGRHKRNATFPGSKATTIPAQQSTAPNSPCLGKGEQRDCFVCLFVCLFVFSLFFLFLFLFLFVLLIKAAIRLVWRSMIPLP